MNLTKVGFDIKSWIVIKSEVDISLGICFSRKRIKIDLNTVIVKSEGR